ncbi:MAG: tRNA (adenosine(37)-N6)-dimethylallyltransferase MiaA [Eubacteriales bacterium]|nr:tRNA (adenosine(37)-N6)-dimethylallyltransferase MiaA [Eubacteriales bacterium]
MNKVKKAIVLGGQTASGKSSLALCCCEHFGGEIISADSMQVYRGMDIGTAKPDAEDMARVKHHLVNIMDIERRFSSADFIKHAMHALEDITSRGKIPFVTGGTGLYSEMLFNSFSLAEGAGDEKVRNELWKKAEAGRGGELYEQLEAVDPLAAAKTHPNNLKRVIRYLEIYLTAGKTPTEMNKINNSGDKIYEPLYICLYSEDRNYIYSRINERVEVMFERGLIEEVSALREKGLENTPTASAAIGYKELFPYFKGEISLEEAKDTIKQHSKNYAKRQQSYFKRIKDVRFIDIKEKDYADKAKAVIEKFLTE